MSLRLFLGIWVGAALVMSGGWWWQRRSGNAGIVDVLWAAALAGSALACAATGSGAPLVRGLVALCGALWGTRLAWHLWTRVRGESEDGRYRQLRAHWQGDQRRFFLFFQFQALLVAVFSLPFAVAAGNPLVRPAWLVTALAIYGASVLGEVLADEQLRRFRTDPGHRGQTCRRGLWRYSRHPNYFFEWLHWWSYVALAMGAPNAIASLAGPLIMYVFLRWVSGIPYTEAQALRTRGDDYRDYQSRTSAFFPWPPRQP